MTLRDLAFAFLGGIASLSIAWLILTLNIRAIKPPRVLTTRSKTGQS